MNTRERIGSGKRGEVFEERRFVGNLVCCVKSTSSFMILYVVHKLRQSTICECWNSELR